MLKDKQAKLNSQIRVKVKPWIKTSVLVMALLSTKEVQAIPETLTYASQFDELFLNYANCGPSILKMIAQDESLTYTEIRQAIGNETPEVYQSEFERGLEVYDVAYEKVKYQETQTLIDAVEGEAVAVVLLDMDKVDLFDSETGLGKNSESLNTGHFVIVTDYVEENGQGAFEVIDPYNPKIGTMYLYSPTAYYSVENIEESMNVWSDDIFIVTPAELEIIIDIINQMILEGVWEMS